MPLSSRYQDLGNQNNQNNNNGATGGDTLNINRRSKSWKRNDEEVFAMTNNLR